MCRNRWWFTLRWQTEDTVATDYWAWTLTSAVSKYKENKVSLLRAKVCQYKVLENDNNLTEASLLMTLCLSNYSCVFSSRSVFHRSGSCCPLVRTPAKGWKHENLNFKLPDSYIMSPPSQVLWGREWHVSDMLSVWIDGWVHEWLYVTVNSVLTDVCHKVFLCFSLTVGWTAMKFSEMTEYQARFCMIFCQQFHIGSVQIIIALDFAEKNVEGGTCLSYKRNTEITALIKAHFVFARL